MKNTIVLLVLLISSIQSFAQKIPFRGQDAVEAAKIDLKPVQKQWKGTWDFGEISVTNDFDGGRLNGLIRKNDSTLVGLITSENTPVNDSPWYAFKIASSEERKLYINLTYQEGVKHRYFPKLSMDGLEWKPLDSINYFPTYTYNKNGKISNRPVEITIKLPVSKETLWVSAQELLTSKHVNNWIEELTSKPFVSKEEIGKSVEGRPIIALTVSGSQSKKVMMIGRQHPPEVTGYLAMKTFVETIAGDTQLAKDFRKHFTTYVVPLVNPDGVDNGHWRHNMRGVDLNRDWAHFEQPETRAVKKFMLSKADNKNSKFYFGIDFHSTWDDIYYSIDDSFKGNMPGLVPQWLGNVQNTLPGYEPNIKPSREVEPTTVSKHYFYQNFGAESLVYEIGDNTSREFLKAKSQVGAEELMKLMLEKVN